MYRRRMSNKLRRRWASKLYGRNSFTSNSVVATEYLTTWFFSFTDSAQTLSRMI
ncbi:hypothetical protein ARMGADRAFT_574823 [Armillaria gallica]|uniref:Uncharacterized protein n=1 Tax=Armillaria gallica TaxID=47427 RepID=A0A2H3EAH1_ARMGA|nr:hypothetical protein ARMGADRAFT_574823 [Armillaria gallica]